MVLTRTLAFVPLLVCLSACDRLPESYPPPEQRHPVAGVSAGPEAMMVEMATAEASQAIVKDIYDLGGSPWRWTAQNPTIKVLVLSTEKLKLSADYALWDGGFKQTGPVELSFFVNGKLLDKVRYATPGVTHFDKPVPADWLTPDTEIPISFSVDKLYVSPRDGKKFGVILTRLGLVP